MTEEQLSELKGMMTEDMIAQHADLFDMLLMSVSLGFEEKKYWLQLYPLMTPEHLSSLREILENEQREMTAVEEGYKDGVKILDFNTTVDRSEYEQKRKEAEAREAAHREEAEREGEDLLKQLSEL